MFYNLKQFYLQKNWYLWSLIVMKIIRSFREERKMFRFLKKKKLVIGSIAS